MSIYTELCGWDYQENRMCICFSVRINIMTCLKIHSSLAHMSVNVHTVHIPKIILIFIWPGQILNLLVMYSLRMILRVVFFVVVGVNFAILLRYGTKFNQTHVTWIVSWIDLKNMMRFSVMRWKIYTFTYNTEAPKYYSVYLDWWEAFFRCMRKENENIFLNLFFLTIFLFIYLFLCCFFVGVKMVLACVLCTLLLVCYLYIKERDT